MVPSERKDPVKKIKNLIYQGKPLCPKSVKRGKCQIRSENHVTVLQGKRSTECTNKPLPQGQQTLISFPCHFRCPIGHFFVCLFGGGVGLDMDQLQRYLISHYQSIHNLSAGKPDTLGWAHKLLIGKLL